jgi:hypothetical protein
MSRSLGSLVLDDNVNTFISQRISAYKRGLQTAQIPNRQGRMTRIKEDAGPLEIHIEGTWRDSSTKFFRDFIAAINTLSRAPLTLGDGTRYEFVDVTDFAYTPIASASSDSVTPDQAYAWTMQLLSYEPFAREVSPTLQDLGALTTSNGSSQTGPINVNCSGSAFSEPLWQFTLVIPSAKTVTMVKLQNATTGEVCTVTPSTPLDTGTWVLLMDASGAYLPASGAAPTPGNNQYGLTTISSVGWGCTLQKTSAGGAIIDQDFTGRPCTLIQSTTPAIPSVANPNAITVTIAATGVLTSAGLKVVAPARYFRV